MKKFLFLIGLPFVFSEVFCSFDNFEIGSKKTSCTKRALDSESEDSGNKRQRLSSSDEEESSDSSSSSEYKSSDEESKVIVSKFSSFEAGHIFEDTTLHIIANDINPMLDKNFCFPNLQTLVIGKSDIFEDNNEIQEALNNLLSNLSETAPNLSSADLSNLYLESFPEAICNFKNLKQLNLKNNDFDTIPDAISNLENLKYLDVSADNPDESIESISSKIGDLKKLKELYLNGNTELESLPKEIGNLTNLEALNIGCCGITQLPSEIGNLVNLKSLRVHDNGNEETRLNQLPKKIGNLINLEELMYSEDDDIPSIHDFLISNTSAVILDLSNKNLTSLPYDIIKWENLNMLNLKGNNFEDFPYFIANLPKLREIDLRNNPKIDSIGNSIRASTGKTLYNPK